jgi:hypothetical protein
LVACLPEKGREDGAAGYPERVESFRIIEVQDLQRHVRGNGTSEVRPRWTDPPSRHTSDAQAPGLSTTPQPPCQLVCDPTTPPNPPLHLATSRHLDPHLDRCCICIPHTALLSRLSLTAHNHEGPVYRRKSRLRSPTLMFADLQCPASLQ